MQFFRTMVCDTYEEEFQDQKDFRTFKDPCISFWSKEFEQHSKHWIYKELQQFNNVVISIFIVVQIGATTILDQQNLGKKYMKHMRWTSLMLLKANEK